MITFDVVAGDSGLMYGREWIPSHARPEHARPEVGWLIAWRHQVWRVMQVETAPEDQWDEEDRARIVARGRKAAPVRVRLRPAQRSSPDPVAAKRRDQWVSGVPFYTQWWVFGDEHYPVCVRCGEPPPCRERWSERVAAAEVAQLSRFESPGVCPACREVCSTRQKTITYSENLYLPGGPEVTFHLRGRCVWEARRYEERWVAADPNRRRTKLSCPGHLTMHGDGTFECTELVECRGPVAAHPSYSACRCSECHRNGYFPIYPARGAVRRHDGPP